MAGGGSSDEEEGLAEPLENTPQGKKAKYMPGAEKQKCWQQRQVLGTLGGGGQSSGSDVEQHGQAEFPGKVQACVLCGCKNSVEGEGGSEAEHVGAHLSKGEAIPA